jgi:UDP-glucose 4-epimerase
MNILLTGGAGYIGSHTAVALSEANHQVVIMDNFSNCQRNILDYLERIVDKVIPCVEGDIRDTSLLVRVLQDYKIDVVMHFAGLKAVGESVQKPIQYFDYNVCGTISLIKAMNATSVKKLVFSSSATVYGSPQYLPLDEAHPTHTTSPYGRSKLHVEEMLADVVTSDSSWRVACLRFFNPIGAHSSGLIGEDPNGIPNNLMPYIARVASGKLPYLNVYSNDYDTPDGTGVRDYIHVMDVAEGHLAALSVLAREKGFHVFNLGTGLGSSVLEMVKAFEQASGKTIPLKFTNRRAGDVASCYANVNKAAAHLSWKATRTLDDMCSSTWNFQKNL